MTKELDNTKIKIQQILAKRSEQLILKQQEKIAIAQDENLSDLFSMLSYSTNESIAKLKEKLNKPTAIDKEIAHSNEDLLNIVDYLNETKRLYQENMSFLERKSGKKRSFVKGNSRVSVSEKYYKKYLSLYNSCREIEKLIEYIKAVLNEKVEVSYKINEEDLKNLSNEELISYYSTLASLIMCEELCNPKEVFLSKNYVVNEEYVDTLIRCYRGYRQASKNMLKENRLSKFNSKAKSVFSRFKNLVYSKFGKNVENKDFLALKKSLAIASLSLGVVAVSVSSQENLISNFISPIACMPITSIPDVEKLKIFKAQGDIDILSLNVAQGGKLLLRKSSSDELPIIGDSITSEYEDESFGENFPENAYEIVKVDTLESDDNLEAETLATVNVQTFENKPVALMADLQSILEGNRTLVSEENTEMKAEEISMGKDNEEVVRGLHLTFNNTTYTLTNIELKALYFVVEHEYNGSYQDALGITSLVVNRLEDPRYPDNVLDVLSAEGQFVVWDDVLRAISKYGDDFEMKEPIYNAINDVLNRGIRNNDYVEFKAPWTSDYSITGEYKVQIAENGNKFHNLAQEVDRTDEDLKEYNKEDSKVLERRVL